MLLGRCPNGGPSHRLLNSPAEAGKGREDMKTLILYCSKSHGNTKKLVDDAAVGSETAAGSEAADGTAPDAGIAEGPTDGQA